MQYQLEIVARSYHIDVSSKTYIKIIRSDLNNSEYTKLRKEWLELYNKLQANLQKVAESEH